VGTEQTVEQNKSNRPLSIRSSYSHHPLKSQTHTSFDIVLSVDTHSFSTMSSNTNVSYCPFILMLVPVETNQPLLPIGPSYSTATCYPSWLGGQ